METAINISGLTKVVQTHFWSPRANILRGVDLEVYRGEIFGFLGPNGAGKTSTIKSLMGIIRPSSGRLEVLGASPDDMAVKQRIGYLPETPYFYDYLTGWEFLSFCGRLFGLAGPGLKSRIHELLALVKMEPAADRQMRKYSKGMLQRIGLAQALINGPELVVLDEPLTGLDPLGRKEFKDIITGLKDRGITVFFSSHILPDAETVCDRVAIISRGKVLKVGRLDQLLEARVESVEMICRGLPPSVASRIRSQANRWLENGPETAYNFADEEIAQKALQEAINGGGQVISLSPIRESLEDYFTREVKRDA